MWNLTYLDVKYHICLQKIILSFFLQLSQEINGWKDVVVILYLSHFKICHVIPYLSIRSFSSHMAMSLIFITCRKLIAKQKKISKKGIHVQRCRLLSQHREMGTLKWTYGNRDKELNSCVVRYHEVLNSIPMNRKMISFVDGIGLTLEQYGLF